MNRLRAQLDAIRSSYWLIPALMALAALCLGAGMIWADATLGSGFIQGISWYQQIRPDGAREVLSIIAGSMITVAGVVFSITMVALSYASSQYGPRVLTNFMTDRGNTITLGTFVATFLYSLMVLRTIRGGNESFVPQYAVMVAMLLAVCSIGVLIYFIHHVLQSIHINNVVGRIGTQLASKMRRRSPTYPTAGRPQATIPSIVGLAGTSVRSHRSGYIQSIDEGELVRAAQAADVLVLLRYRAGDFVTHGRGLVDIFPADRWPNECDERLRQCFTVAPKRTPDHDMMFLVSELVEIAARALSPGVNDPMTAVSCLDWLGAAATEFCTRDEPGPVHCDENGAARLIAHADDFAYFMRCSFGRLRQYAARDVIASLQMLQVLGEVAAACRSREQLARISTEADRLSELALHELKGDGARRVGQRSLALKELLSRGAGQIDAAQADWLEGIC